MKRTKKILLSFLILSMGILNACHDGTHHTKKPKENTPPPEVTNLKITSTQTTTTLTWRIPEDTNIDYILIIYRDNIINVPAGIQTKTISNLSKWEKYSFTVKTVDFNNNISTGVQISIGKNITKIVPDDVKRMDSFACKIASYKDTVAIGAYGYDEGSRIGTVYIFQRNKETLKLEKKQKITIDGEKNDYFGYSLDILKNTLAVGAERDDDKGCNAGAVYVFEKNETTSLFEEKQKITATNGEAEDYFGNSIKLFENSLAIGAYKDHEKGEKAGAVYVFEKNETTSLFEEKQKIIAPDGQNHNFFGNLISVCEEYICIGAYGNNDGTGAVYVFEKNETTSLFEEKQKLIAKDGQIEDCFGISIKIYNDTIVIGAQGNQGNESFTGSAYVFERNKTTLTFEQTEKIIAPDGQTGDHFGNTIDIDEGFITIGAQGDDDNGSDSGSFYDIAF